MNCLTHYSIKTKWRTDAVYLRLSLPANGTKNTICLWSAAPRANRRQQKRQPLLAGGTKKITCLSAGDTTPREKEINYRHS